MRGHRFKYRTDIPANRSGKTAPDLKKSMAGSPGRVAQEVTAAIAVKGDQSCS